MIPERVFERRCGFTVEELDFIPNHAIKDRLGRDTEEGE
jgi:hypothetical protein